MYKYDYIKGIERVKEIVNNSEEIERPDTIPNDSSFTFENSFYGWVSSIFVDIRESTKLFANNEKSETAKIIRAFTSEIIEILRNNENLRDIGIRGDCVFAIYAVSNDEDGPNINQVDEIANKAIYVNTFLSMLNSILSENNMDTIKAGIGVSISKDLVIKAGRIETKINSKVFVGKAVTYASKLSNIAGKKECDNYQLLMTELMFKLSYTSIKNRNKNKDVDSWYKKYSDNKIGCYYGWDIVKEDFYNWIKGGMKDDRK